MKEQNFQNHKKYVIGYHVIAFSLLLILFILSLYNVYVSFKNRYDMRASLMFLISSVLLISLFFYARLFALKAQDRAIRAEENLRHFALAGTLLDSNLMMSQIIALRFVSDEEFVELARKAGSDKLTSDEIKKSIKNWKIDNDRV